MTFDDLMDDILNSYRELALRMSISAAATNDSAAFNVSNQTVPYVSQLVQVQFAVDIRYLIAAVLVSMAGVLAVVPLFWGYWALGRSVSMSPLEIVNAFHADGRATGEAEQICPGRIAANLFDDYSRNATADELVQSLEMRTGNRAAKVRYGVLTASGRLAMAIEDEDGVRRPRRGESL